VLLNLERLKAFIYLVQDNFSRAILYFKCSLQHTAKHSFENPQNVHKYFLSPTEIEHCNLTTDDGIENHGEASAFLDTCKSMAISHLIAQKTIVHSNSMIEAANKHVKYHFLYHKEIAKFEQLKNCLPLSIKD
jgi:putative transposase